MCCRRWLAWLNTARSPVISAASPAGVPVPPIGVLPDPQHHAETVLLASGTQLVIATDGFVEGAGLTAEAKDKILGGNAARLLRL